MAPSIWDTLQFHELTEIVIQKDTTFAELLIKIFLKNQTKTLMLTKCCKLMNYNLMMIILYTQNLYFIHMHKMQDIGIGKCKMIWIAH